MAPELDDTSEDPVKDDNEDEDCEECSNALPRNSPLERVQPAQCALRPVIRGLGIRRSVLPLLQARVVPPHEQSQRRYEKSYGEGFVHGVPNVRVPNGPRLSCGRNTSGRKVVEPQIQRLASEATQFLPTGERPPASSAC